MAKTCGCCSWPRFIILVILLAVAGVLIWLFVPEDSVKDIVPQPNVPTATEPAAAPGDNSEPTAAPVDNSYQFMQCQDMNNCCNGLEEICDLGVDDILWAMSHNAMSSQETGFLLAYNHLYGMENSLKAGYRGLSLDVCNCGGEYQLCHGICVIGALDPTEVFTNIVNFLNENPTEIIMINLQLNSEVSDEVDLNYFASLMNDNVAGFSDRLYIHDPSQTWPTLRDLTGSGQTLLLFHLNGPDCSDGSCPGGFHYWFDYAAETEFEFATASEVADTTNSCKVTRGASSSLDFFAVNSFATPASRDESAIINARDFLEGHMQACSDSAGLDVNVMYVDFWHDGDLPEVVQTHNKALGQRRQRELLV